MKLTDENIFSTVKDSAYFFDAAGVAKKDIEKIILILEDSLTQFKEKFGEDHEFTIRRKKWFSTPQIIIRVKGAPFNPLQNDDPEISIFSSSVMQNLLNIETARTVYRYEDGYNEISSFSTKERKPLKIPGGQITIAILAAVVCSFLLQFLPQNMQNILIQDCPSLIKTFMGVIVAVTGPFIFMSIVAGILAIDSIDKLNTIGLKIICRFMAISFVFAIIAAAVCQIFFPVIVLEIDDTQTKSQFLDLFLKIIPTNLFTPFTEGNVLQIVIVGILFAVCILSLGNVVQNVKTIVGELNRIMAKMLNLVSKLIVATIFLTIFNLLTTTTFQSLAEVWNLILVNFIVVAIMIVLMLLRLYIRHKINIKDFLGKISKILLISLTTGSNTASMPKNFEVAVKSLKVDEKFLNFWLPLSHSIFSPGSTVALVIAVFYSAQFSNATISLTELFMTIFLALQLSITTPPVVGGIIPIYVMILQQVNLGTEAIGLLMIAGIFTVNIAAVSSTIVRDCELMDIAHKLNYIKQESRTLRKAKNLK